jgi:hypothetical protein
MIRDTIQCCHIHHENVVQRPTYHYSGISGYGIGGEVSLWERGYSLGEGS